MKRKIGITHMNAKPQRDELTIRHASPHDAAAIASIYNQGIDDGNATMETELRTPEERRFWVTAREPRYPVIVAEARGKVVGWGSLNVFNPREVYRHVADFSLYVEREWRGTGVGSRLLADLIELAKRLDFHKMVLAAFPSNEGGMALYRKFGFREVGVYKEHGFHRGQWADIIIMEKLL